MRIKNLTSDVRCVTIIDFEGDREFNITIEGNGETELVGAYVKNMQQYAGILEIVGNPFATSPEPIVVESDLTPDNPTPEDTTVDDSAEDSNVSEDTEEDAEESTGEPEVVGDKFICDVCGAEFASARGLSSHMSRSHQE